MAPQKRAFINRANTYCADPDCGRAVCADPTMSVNFCCRMCEVSFFGSDWGQKHGVNCNKKRKPLDENAPRAPPERTDEHTKDLRNEAQVAAASSQLPQRELEAGPPTDFIWDVMHGAIRDRVLGQRLYRFLTKCWTYARGQVSRGLTMAQQREVFVRSWISETISRVFAIEMGSTSNRGAGQEEFLAMFQRLCAHEGLPRFLRGRLSEGPVIDTILIQDVVRTTWALTCPEKAVEPPLKVPRLEHEAEQGERPRVVLLPNRSAKDAPGDAQPLQEPLRPPPAHRCPSPLGRPAPAAVEPSPGVPVAALAWEAAAVSFEDGDPDGGGRGAAGEAQRDRYPHWCSFWRCLGFDAGDHTMARLRCAAGSACRGMGNEELWRDLVSGRDWCVACWDADETEDAEEAGQAEEVDGDVAIVPPPPAPPRKTARCAPRTSKEGADPSARSSEPPSRSRPMAALEALMAHRLPTEPAASLPGKWLPEAAIAKIRMALDTAHAGG